MLCTALLEEMLYCNMYCNMYCTTTSDAGR